MYKSLKGTDWGRDALIEKYSSYDLPYIIITADVDVTKLYSFSKERGISFYMAMIYCVMHTASSIKNFHYRITDDGEPVYCENLTASYTYLPKGWEQFYVVDCPFEDDMISFCKKAKDMAEAVALGGDKLITPPTDLGAIYISVLPWIKYSGFIRTIENGGKDNIPRVSWGKYEKTETGRIVMPVSVQVHHGLMDGFHVGKFYEGLQEFLNIM